MLPDRPCRYSNLQLHLTRSALSRRFSTQAATPCQFVQRQVIKAVAQTLTVEGFGTIGATSGQLLVTSLGAAPSKITVKSSGGGLNQMQVTTAGVSGGGPAGPLAENDTA